MSSSGKIYGPLDIAATNGHSCVVREMIKQRGIEGCNGACGGWVALRGAAQHRHLDIMTMLTDAGVVDIGRALRTAAAWGVEESVKFLLQQRQLERSPSGVVEYVNLCEPSGHTALFASIDIVADTEGVHLPISPGWCGCLSTPEQIRRQLFESRT